MEDEQEHDPATVETSWEVRQDEASGQVYYWNAITGETSWEPPPHLQELHNTGNVVPPWTQTFDDDGRVYYLNTETMETRWTPPETIVVHQEEPPSTSEPDVLAVTRGRGRRPSTAEQMTELNRLLSGEDDGEEEEFLSEAPASGVNEVVSTIEEKAAVDPEAFPWMMFVNEDDGVPYYYNHITGECLWDPPEEFLRFHQEQQPEQQQLKNIDETTVTDTEIESQVLLTSRDHIDPQNSSADSTVDNGSPDDIATHIIITPEFEEKVRQAVAAVSNTPVSSSRLVLVRTPTQQQLAQYTGRLAGDSISARSRPSSARPQSGSNSARPRSGPSRPSSSGAISRPRTPSGAVTSSRIDTISTTEEGSTAFEEEISTTVVENEPQSGVAEVPDDTLPALNERVDEGQFPLTIHANGAEESETFDSDAGVANDEEAINDMATGSVSRTEPGAEADRDLILLASAEALLNSETDNGSEEVHDADAGFQDLIDTTEEMNTEADMIIGTEVAVVADEHQDSAVFRQNAHIAALTLQCMIRCFVARQRVKHKRAERQNATPPAAIEILPGVDDITATATAPSAMVPEVGIEEDPNVLPVLSAREAQTQEFFPNNTVQNPPCEDENSNKDSTSVFSSIVDQQPQTIIARSWLHAAAHRDTSEIDLPTEKSPSVQPSVASVPVQSSSKLSPKMPTQNQNRSSTRLPSVLDVTKYFPQQRGLNSSHLTHSGSTTDSNDQVAITRKKVDLGSLPRPRRASQQEIAEHEQLLETRRKEEERAGRAQVIEYQRIYMESRKAFKAETQRFQHEKLARDNQCQHDAEVEKCARIQAQHERDAARSRSTTPVGESDQLVWEHLKIQGRPTEKSVSRFREALAQALDSAQFPTKLCTERARELHERIKRLHRASWAVDSQLEDVELRLLSELHPLTSHQRPLQAKYAVKLRYRLEQMINTVQSWQRVIDEWEENGSTSRYWSGIQALYTSSSVISSSDESRRQYVLNSWRGAAGGDSLLHVAAWNGWQEHVRLLIEEGADVNLIDSSASHRTPLHEACRAGHVPAVELLLRSGARLNAVDVSGDSPLHVACRGGWTRVVRILLMAANDLGEEMDPSATDKLSPMTLEVFFNLHNGKGRRAIEVATLPSLIEELQNYDYQLNGVTQQDQQNNGVRQKQVKTYL